MKKISIILMLIIFLSSCSMHTNELSTEKLFYGEQLIGVDDDSYNNIANTPFIYSPDKPNHYEKFGMIR